MPFKFLIHLCSCIQCLVAAFHMLIKKEKRKKTKREKKRKQKERKKTNPYDSVILYLLQRKVYLYYLSAKIRRTTSFVTAIRSFNEILVLCKFPLTSRNDAPAPIFFGDLLITYHDLIFRFISPQLSSVSICPHLSADPRTLSVTPSAPLSSRVDGS